MTDAWIEEITDNMAGLVPAITTERVVRKLKTLVQRY